MSQEHPTRRLTEYLEQYWDQKRGDRNFPAYEDIDIKDIEPDFRVDCFVLELIPTITQHIIKTVYLGENLNAKFQRDEAGVHIKNIIVRFLETPMDHYNKVIETKKPLFQSIEIPKTGKKKIKSRQILLPLGPSDEGPITAILGGMRYKKGD